MNLLNPIWQSPEPGARILMFRGDTLRFTLSLDCPAPGRAWIRTNIGHASITRKAVIDSVDQNISPLGVDWFDIPLRQISPHQFTISLPLNEVGHFEAKCFFMATGHGTPLWPEGPNTTINVEPADTCCANIIYNAFVRQFGINKDGRHLPDASEAQCIDHLDRKGYTVIPKSGTFRDLIRELDFIIGKLGCRYIHLLPIHPIPTTYGRMGRFGSPYAALNFTGIDPALAVFDIQTTPLEQFIELVDGIHQRQGKLILDIAVNHTGWAATLHETHPHWLLRDPDGDIKSPGAWGVTWRDLTSLDYSQKDLWKYIADVFLTWCRRDVDGFRCDAGYMIPLPAWTYITAIVREQFPDTIFLLEGLGGEISVTRNLLNRANLNWAYSELFQNYSRAQIENYLPEAIDTSRQDGITIHYAETHDNNRLAVRSQTFARMRTALCALSSCQGGFGFANGVEWFADIKINVHEAESLNWNNPVNQVEEIHRLTILLRSHPAFFEEVDLKLIQQDDGNFVALLRWHKPSGKKLVVVVNLDDEQPVNARWEFQADMARTPLIDLLTGHKIVVTHCGDSHTCKLSPGEVLCLTSDENDLNLLDHPENLSFRPEHSSLQQIKAKVLDVYCHYHGIRDILDVDLGAAARRLVQNPVEFCRQWNTESDEHRVIFWQWPCDLKREVLLPPKHFLLVKANDPFRAAIIDNRQENEQVISREESLPASNGTYFILFAPRGHEAGNVRLTLKITIFEKDRVRHEKAPLLFLSQANSLMSPVRLGRNKLLQDEHLFLSTNGRGAMCRANVRWGKLTSKYDALLAANLNPGYPEDRWIMFTRCRGWIVYQSYSQEISFDTLDAFRPEDNRGLWQYKIPTGQGESIDLHVTVEMIDDENAVRLAFHRPPSNKRRERLNDNEAVQLILRPDIEDRNFHETTKAYQGPEKAWPSATTVEPDAFVFAPAPDRKLTLRISSGIFVCQPEWQYMVHYPVEEERGLDTNSDLWSPGYFSAEIKGNETVFLTAVVNREPSALAFPSAKVGAKICSKPMGEWQQNALRRFIVKRDHMKSVIAGYPWFLDWGRDSLIFCRGLIQTETMEEARAILKLFGSLEDRGTLPNMIHGNRTGNRTTSDAPLWFMVACDDLIRKEKSPAFLMEKCDSRTIREILLSIGNHYVEGTPTQIHMDRASGLIFSPACFTWMDTNHPACTPRQGYCIEIQALWHAALEFLSTFDQNGRHDWKDLANAVSQNIMDLFVLKKGYLSDCLHSTHDEPAKNARPDDALRPNQLLAVTLGAVTDRTICRSLLDACQSLLIPGAIRSLADAAAEYPLEMLRDKEVICRTFYPYRGYYTGDEDTCRKPAYHNGTAWAWLFPAYCEAYVKVYGTNGIPAARALLLSSQEIIQKGCIGHCPEILDGDYPHAQRGCDAQAWGLSEWLRVWKLLELLTDL